MAFIYNISFVIVALACIAFGVIFMARKKARIFYGIHVEGPKATLAGLVLVLAGIAVLIFGLFIFPNIFDIEGILQDVPEFRN